MTEEELVAMGRRNADAIVSNLQLWPDQGRSRMINLMEQLKKEIKNSEKVIRESIEKDESPFIIEEKRKGLIRTRAELERFETVQKSRKWV